MTVNLRFDHCCVAIVEKKRCTRPASEPGGFCSRCWQALPPNRRGFLRWEAAWTAPEKPKPLVTVAVEPPTLQERFAAYYEQREVLRLYAGLARFEDGP